MSGDFLDNVIARVGEPQADAVQPRLASRFETPSALMIDIGAPSDSAVEDDVTEHSRPRPSNAAHATTASEIVQRPAASADEATANVPVVSIESPTASDVARKATDTDFAGRLDALTRRLDTFRAPDLPAEPTPDVLTPAPETMGAETPQSPTTPSITVNELVEHHHSHQTLMSVEPHSDSTDIAAASFEHSKSPPTISVETPDTVPLSDRDGGGRRHFTPDRAPRKVRIDAVPNPASDFQNAQTPVNATGELEPPKIAVDQIPSTTVEQRTFNVTIGQIELRAESPQQASPVSTPRPAPRRVMSLDDYLSLRSGGSR